MKRNKPGNRVIVSSMGCVIVQLTPQPHPHPHPPYRWHSFCSRNRTSRSEQTAEVPEDKAESPSAARASFTALTTVARKAGPSEPRWRSRLESAGLRLKSQPKVPFQRTGKTRKTGPQISCCLVDERSS